ncbi:enoyl-CoA hydratase/isomerase family protein [Jatrophihabitans sp. DSM 45814]
MAPVHLDQYVDKFEHVRLARDEHGILEVTFHTAGSDLVWGLVAHEEIAEAWDSIARDSDNRVVIVTGAGESFISEGGIFSGSGNWITPEGWKRVHTVGRRMVMSHLDIEVPMIAAVNGPATIHSEQALLCDIVIASDDALFADRVHFVHGVVPGDGIQVIWPHLIGLNRGRYMMLMGQEFSAKEAKELGVVNEVVPKGNVLARAREIAQILAAKPTVALRSTRMLLVSELRKSMSDGVDLGLMAEGIAGMQHWPQADTR